MVTQAEEVRLHDAGRRQNLAVFAQSALGLLNPGTDILWNWHLDAICHALGRVMRGETRRLIITLPPRSLKSGLVSVSFPAFLLGHRPSAKIMVLSSSADLAGTFARQSRALMKSEFYCGLFPQTLIGQERDAAADFQTTRRGSRTAVSLGGTLTGRGADVIIVDDLMNADDVHSDVKRTNALQWFDNTVPTRLNDKRGGAMIIVQQRLHVDDLVGHVLAKSGDWAILNLPAIADEEEQIPIGRNRFHLRKPGDILHPEREGREELDRLKIDMGSINFSAQYQQNPIPPDGGVFRKAWIRRYGPEEFPEEDYEIIQSWDIGLSEKATSDYSVGTIWFVKDDRYYLIDLVRERLNYPDLKRTVIKNFRDYPTATLLIEDVGTGTSLIQDLEVEGIDAIPWRPKADKVVRAMSVSAVMEAGRIRFPQSEPYVDDLEQELLAFPKGKHDDQVDSLVQAIAWREERQRHAVQLLIGHY